jgi:hypothetical protein
MGSYANCQLGDILLALVETPKVIPGIKFTDGIKAVRSQAQAAA